MGFLQHSGVIDPEAIHFSCLRTIYNFTYRLSGDAEVAETLTEKAVLMHMDQADDVILLKQVWKDFLKDYGSFGFQGEDQIQQALLSLSPEPRCAVILRDVLGYSYGQIGSVLNKSNLEVGSLISLGRHHIIKYHKNQI